MKPIKRLGLLLLLLAMPLFVSAQYTEYDWEERDEWMNLDHILEAVGVE
ncbi:MAG: methyltransferase type 11, partial [Flavobacteriaceae bacterium]|nr:methyltransferase type 11 [Flavobacteriaceae bacterium]